ncbi:hypothetical protein EUZ85_11100 [Hahella sp. KA22]|uniref:hypothetical protein n=1 Tax=Hahella sp. KA22 TaxID=1628392 RepID=UPI000FDE578D|nr:hypothetical protein [Hahella sp. KA22]AZZ91245.1 hypothetical protein ENC22_08545 [Hahella sp. KA22]QAY54613.1 hypothetical protein EUZ85_11100 [Hahella sp. KA22]
MENPQKTPVSSFVEHKLYKVSGIGIATFLGSALAGGILLAKNFRKLGKESHARKAIAGSLAATIGVIIAALLVPAEWHVPKLVYFAPQIMVMLQLANLFQGKAIRGHRENGGELASNWAAAGVGVTVLLTLAVFAAPVLWMLQ